MTLLSHHDDHAAWRVGESALTRYREVVRATKAVLRGGGRPGRATSPTRERQHASPAALLVPDLLIEFFDRLSFNDRLRVSHVNQHWRWVALSTPLLWSNFVIRDHWQEGKLDAMLRRSLPAPLSVALLLEPDEEAATALRPHFGRLRALRCQGPPEKLDSPILETLELVRHSLDPVVLSEDYVGASARSLRTLQLRPFRIATTCPVFSRLREFRAVFSPQTDLRLLLGLCPALESLTVRCDIYLAVDPRPLFVALPPRLIDVTISGIIKWVDYSNDSLRLWRNHHFHRLEFARLDNISKGLHLFARSVAEPDATWSMEVHLEGHGPPISENGVFTLRTATNSIMRVIVPAPPGKDHSPRTHSLQQFPHIGKLTDLRLTPRFFETFCWPDLEFSGVRTLAVVANPERGDDGPFHVDKLSGLKVPLLRSFAFACRPGQAFSRATVKWFFATLPRHFRQWVRYDAEKLDTVSLEGIIPEDGLKWVVRRRIYSLAREVRVDTSVGSTESASEAQKALHQL